MKKYIFVASIFLIVLILSGCFLIQKQPSATVQLISPPNGSTDVSTNVSLSWQISGKFQPTEYEIFLGTTSTPSLFATSETNQIKINDLQFSTVYYWEVEAISQGEQSAGENTNQTITSPIWSFVTQPSSQSNITIVMGTLPATVGGNQSFCIKPTIYHKFSLKAATATISNISVNATNLNSSSLNFEFNGNLKNLKSGSYTLYVSAEDVKGNVASAYANLYINNSSPSISFITVPATVNSGQTKNVSVLATAIGSGNFISSVEIGGIQAVQSNSNPYEWTASITFSGTGVQTLRATATDNFNNTSSVMAHILYMVQVIIPDTTKVLNQSSIQHLTYVSTNQSIFEFTGSSSQISALKPGDVIVSGVNSYTPQGALRKIVSIQTNTSNNTITVYTTSTTLNQAIEQGSLYYSTVLNTGQIASSMPLMKGVKVTPVFNTQQNPESGISASSSETFTYDISCILDTSATGLTIQLNGSISFSLGFDLSINIGLFGNSAYFDVNQSEQSNLNVTAGFSASTSVSKPIYTIEFDPITVSIGFVPVVINPYATIYIDANGNLSVNLSAGVTQQENFTLGAQYENNSWSPIFNLTNSIKCSPPEIEGSCNFDGDVGAQIGIQLYWGLGSLYIQPEGYLTFNAQFFEQLNNLESGWLSWNLYGGFQATVGANIAWGLASYTSPPLFNFSKLLIQSPPANPVLTISSTSANSVSLSWQEVAPNVDGFKILRSYNGGNFTDISNTSSNVTTYTDSSMNQNGLYEYEVAAYNSDLLGTNASTSNSVQVEMSNIPASFYPVSGYVTNATGNGIPGVTISFSNGATPVTTNASGYWMDDLSGTVVVTPSLSGYTFTPVSATVDGTNNNVNFIGTVSGFNSSFIFQGFDGQEAEPTSTTSWPSILTGQAVQEYWSPVQSNNSQAVLELVGNELNYAFWSAGTVIFNSYYNGSSLSVNLSGVYTSTSGWIADGYEVGLFLTPNNYISSSNSISYWLSCTQFSGQSYLFNTNPPQGVFGPLTSSGLQGAVMFPYSPTPYILVQWDPVFSSGQFDVFLVSCSSPSDVPNFVTYSNIGNGGFEPNAGDILNFDTEYIATTNSIESTVTDMNTSQMATLTIQLPNNFSPPESGSYAVSISGNSGDGSANWGLLNWNALTGTMSTFNYKVGYQQTNIKR